MSAIWLRTVAVPSDVLKPGRMQRIQVDTGALGSAGGNKERDRRAHEL
jgi:hypothetical protein